MKLHDNSLTKAAALEGLSFKRPGLNARSQTFAQCWESESAVARLIAGIPQTHTKTPEDERRCKERIGDATSKRWAALRKAEGK